MPSTILSNIFTFTHRNNPEYPHFITEETKPQRKEIFCLKFHAKWKNQYLHPSILAPDSG